MATRTSRIDNSCITGNGPRTASLAEPRYLDDRQPADPVSVAGHHPACDYPPLTSGGVQGVGCTADAALGFWPGSGMRGCRSPGGEPPLPCTRREDILVRRVGLERTLRTVRAPPDRRCNPLRCNSTACWYSTGARHRCWWAECVGGGRRAGCPSPTRTHAMARITAHSGSGRTAPIATAGPGWWRSGEGALDGMPVRGGWHAPLGARSGLAFQHDRHYRAAVVSTVEDGDEGHRAGHHTTSRGRHPMHLELEPILAPVRAGTQVNIQKT